MTSLRVFRPGGPSLIPALGITQVFGYGTLFYAFTVLAPRMTADFGWAPEWTFGGFAIGLLLGGAVAPVTGSLIDRYGTRLVMTIGSALAGLSLMLAGIAALRLRRGGREPGRLPADR